jgi:hypothetical protein
MKGFLKKLLLSISILTIVENTGFGAAVELEHTPRVPARGSYGVAGRGVNQGLVKGVHVELPACDGPEIPSADTFGARGAVTSFQASRVLLVSGLNAGDLRDLALIIGREKIPVVDISACSEVTTIPESAFSDCYMVKMIHFPRNLEEIKAFAFRGCARLEGLYTIARTLGTESFRGCTNLKCVILPAIVGELSPGSFRGCCSLSSIYIPNIVTSTGNRAFVGCVTQLGDSAFEDCILEDFVLPEHIQRISKYCFSRTRLASLVVPWSCREIGNAALLRCYFLKSVDMRNSQIETIGADAFCECRSLQHVSISPRTIVVQDGAFEGCKTLESINLSGVRRFGEHILAGCDRLKWLTIPCDLDIQRELTPVEIFYNRFGNVKANVNVLAGIPEDCIIDGLQRRTRQRFLDEKCVTIDRCDCTTRYLVKTLQGTWVKEVVDPNFSGTIAPELFSRHCAIRVVQIPKAKKIGSCAFYACDSLTRFDGRSVEVIKSNAFGACSRLKTVRLGWNVQCKQEEGCSSYQFRGCSNLDTLQLAGPRGYFLADEEKKARLKAILLDGAGNESVELYKRVTCVVEEI